MKIRKKQYNESNVYDEAIKRTEHLFDSFDTVVVSFSGGKDSTAVLNVALEVARRRNKLPLKVQFYDEEAIHPPTIEYVERMRQNPEIDMEWYCLEFKHRNACSNEEPFWYCWDKEAKDRWVRPMPEHDCVISEHPKFHKGLSFQDFSAQTIPMEWGRTAMLTGIRTEESLRRYQVIARKKNEPFINTKAEPKSNMYKAYPIYDWSSRDVWIAVHKFGWDYNTTYDIFNQTQLYGRFLKQRVCPPFGEEPLRGLHLYKICFPEMYHKMVFRVKGVNTAIMYANTELYSKVDTKPEHMTWQEYIMVILDSYDTKHKNLVKKSLNSYIKMHHKKSKLPVTEDTSDPLSGVCWKNLCRVAQRGDFKGRQKQWLSNEAQRQMERMGITFEEAKTKYAR